MGAELNSGSSAVVIEEGVPTGGGPGTTWVSPAGIGYRRPGTASSGSGSSGSDSGSTSLTGNRAAIQRHVRR